MQIANKPGNDTSVTVKPGQAFCPRIKIWFCFSKFEFILRSNFSTLNRKRTSQVKPRFQQLSLLRLLNNNLLVSSANVLKIFRWDTRNFLVNHVQPSSQDCVDKRDIVVHLYRRLAIAMTIKRNCCSINSEMF